MSFKPRGALAAWWKTRDGGQNRKFTTGGSKGSFPEMPFYFVYVCVRMSFPARVSEPAFFLFFFKLIFNASIFLNCRWTQSHTQSIFHHKDALTDNTSLFFLFLSQLKSVDNNACVLHMAQKVYFDFWEGCWKATVSATSFVLYNTPENTLFNQSLESRICWGFFLYWSYLCCFCFILFYIYFIITYHSWPVRECIDI